MSIKPKNIIFIPFYSLKLHPIFTETLKTMKKTLVACISIISIYGCQTSKQPQSQNNLVQPASSPTMMTLGTSEVKTNEFKYVYSKNNANTPEAFTEKSLKDYLELYTNFRLKILAAEAEGKDTISDFKTELEGYRKQLAQPYLTEKGVTEQLIKEAYERMKKDILLEQFTACYDS